jgi:hypothetical protein
VSKSSQHLRTETLEQILEVTRKLAAPYDLTHMLSEVIEAARTVLHAPSVSRRHEASRDNARRAARSST